MNPGILPALLVFAGVAAGAGGCEESFKKSGNPLTGAKYDASVTVPDLSVAAAVAQVHGIAIARKLDILSEDAANGAMLLEDPESTWKRAIPYVVGVTAEGSAARVQMTLKLNKGVFAKAETVQARVCSLLNELTGGKAGEDAASRAADAAAVREARKVDAVTLSRELARQTAESAESIPLRHKGRSYTLSGRVAYVIKNGDAYRVAFDIPEPRNAIDLPGMKGVHFKIDISCLMAPRHAAWAVALREGEKVKITGEYYDYDQFKKVMWLKDCRPEQ